MTYFGQWNVSRYDISRSMKETCKFRLAHFWPSANCSNCSNFLRQGQSRSANSPPNLVYECTHLRWAKSQTHNLRIIIIDNCYFKHWVLEVTYTAMPNWHSNDMTTQIKMSLCRNKEKIEQLYVENKNNIALRMFFGLLPLPRL